MSATTGHGHAQTDQTEALARLFAEVLEIPEVAHDGDFFALGGNSMLGVELMFRIASDIGHKLPVKVLVDARTPAALAGVLAGR